MSWYQIAEETIIYSVGNMDPNIRPQVITKTSLDLSPKSIFPPNWLTKFYLISYWQLVSQQTIVASLKAKHPYSLYLILMVCRVCRLYCWSSTIIQSSSMSSFFFFILSFCSESACWYLHSLQLARHDCNIKHSYTRLQNLQLAWTKTV